MNVMAQAHKATKAETIRLARDYRPGIFVPYRELFVHFLKKAHKEYKAMKAANPYVKMIEDCKARIAELEAIEHKDGYIVVIGDNIRLPVKEHNNGWTRVEEASIFWYVEDARNLASRVTNGAGEKGQVVKKVDQIEWELSEQRILLAQLEEFVAQQ